MLKLFVVLAAFCVIQHASAIQEMRCYNCVRNVNIPNYVECKTMDNIKAITCPKDSVGCAAVRTHAKGQFAEFRRECVGKSYLLSGPNGYCESKRKNDTQLTYFNCYTCKGDKCNKVLLN